MKVEVTFYIAGSLHKETVIVEKFSQADQVASARQPVGRIVNRRIVMK
tara:strand:- start:151 stop:294 length:144 start_codon:yes stop_codon:yes gene_type:complete